MKKLNTSASPFLMMIIPVVLFIGLTLNSKTNNSSNEELSNHTLSVKSVTETVVSVAGPSIVNFILGR